MSLHGNPFGPRAVDDALASWRALTTSPVATDEGDL
jgi:hypothetical protein